MVVFSDMGPQENIVNFGRYSSGAQRYGAQTLGCLFRGLTEDIFPDNAQVLGL